MNEDMEALKTVIGKMLMTRYRMGLAVGSKSEVFANGEVYDINDLAEMYKEQDAEAGRVLAKLAARQGPEREEG